MRKFLLFTLLLLSTLTLGAQNVSDLILSEALAAPDSTGILDDYGRRGGWVELYNTSTGTVSYGGCFLTDDLSNLCKSPIPRADLKTKLGPRQCAVIFCSGNHADGSFYAGFTLEPGKTVYLVSNDGRTVIDSLQIPANLPEGRSVIKLAQDIRQKHFAAQAEPAIPTPGALNGGADASTKAQEMAEEDPHGWTLTVVSVSVVFSALAILWFFFWLLFDRPAKKKAIAKQASGGPHVVPGKASPTDEVAAAIAMALDLDSAGEDYAAIATAVHLYLTESVHDLEPYTVTIRRASSAWGDKSTKFRRLPR
jgi:hypothetical protein